MMTDDPTLYELHTFAERLGLKRRWAQSLSTDHPHYDLSPSKRAEAVRLGAVEIGRWDEMLIIWSRRLWMGNKQYAKKIKSAIAKDDDAALLEAETDYYNLISNYHKFLINYKDWIAKKKP